MLEVLKKTGDFLDKSTWTLAALLIVLILLSNLGLKGNGAEDSKLLQGDGIENNIPVTTPEDTPTTDEGSTLDTIK